MCVVQIKWYVETEVEVIVRSLNIILEDYCSQLKFNQSVCVVVVVGMDFRYFVSNVICLSKEKNLSSFLIRIAESGHFYRTENKIDDNCCFTRNS